MFRVGQGYDIHPLVKGRPLILGGINIPFHMGLIGHSDADALLHATIDAILGAIGFGDIGGLFPDTDPAFYNIDSQNLLLKTKNILLTTNWEVINIDSTIIAEAPKLAPYIDRMRQNIASILEIDMEVVNIKSKTNEKLGYLGKQKAIATQVIVLCKKLSTKYSKK